MRHGSRGDPELRRRIRASPAGRAGRSEASGDFVGKPPVSSRRSIHHSLSRWACVHRLSRAWTEGSRPGPRDSSGPAGARWCPGELNLSSREPPRENLCWGSHLNPLATGTAGLGLLQPQSLVTQDPPGATGLSGHGGEPAWVGGGPRAQSQGLCPGALWP